MSKASEYAKNRPTPPRVTIHGITFTVNPMGGLGIEDSSAVLDDLSDGDTAQLIKWLRETFED